MTPVRNTSLPREHDFKRQARQPADHFEKLLEVTYPNHAYPVRHKLKEYSMMKNYMTTGALAKGKKPEDDPRGKAATPFPWEEAVMAIYDEPVPHKSRRKLKHKSRMINAVSLATPEYLRWSESPITFDQIDHPDSIPKPGRFCLIVDPLVRTTQLTKALMNGDSGLKFMYLDAFEGLGLTRDQLKSNPHTSYGVVLGKQSILLGQVALPVTFRDTSNYRTEALTFKVVDFFVPYHIILGWPCYVRFMTIPSYAYLELKIPGPTGVITVKAKTQWALDYKQNSIELATAMAELRELCLGTPPSSTSPAMPSLSNAFKAAEDAKAVQIDTEDLVKTILIVAGLSPK
jgi:hypothetical protein